MRQFIAIFSLVALLFAAAAPVFARGHIWTHKPKDRGTSDYIDCLYNATIPWPFNRHGGIPGDADGDGVIDANDQCPDTPKGATVDAKGCPADGDGDGVYDGIDQCPGTKSGAKVDEKGCVLDGDRDGVPDGIDQCPDTPKGATVNAKGCPSDADGDGVYDGIDRCPNTPKGTAVDDKGCPVESSQTEMEFLDTGMIRTSKITFESGKADLKSDSYPVLDEIGGVLVQWPELEIEIGGHTDSQGSEAFNQTLSQQRAASVRDYLVEKYPKIDQSKITTKGYGEGTPIATNDTKEGRAQNRRVEFTVLNKDTLKREIERKGLKSRR